MTVRQYFATVQGNFGAANFGDDLLLWVVLQQISQRFPGEPVAVLCKPAAYLRQWFPEITFLDQESHGSFETQFMILGGGTQFFSFTPSLVRSRLRLFNLIKHLSHPVRSARRLKRLITGYTNPIRAQHRAAISLGLGPFLGSSGRAREATQTLGSCEWISVRDSISFEWLKDQGIVNARLHDDLVLAPELWLTGGAERFVGHSRNGIGVILRRWPHDAAGQCYLDPLMEAVRRMREEGLSVRYISFAKEYDAPVLAQLLKMGEDVLCWDPCTKTIDQFTLELSGFQGVISARAHGLLIAASLGIPSVAVELEPKLRVIRERITSGIFSWGPPFDVVELLGYARIVGRHDSFLEGKLNIEASLCSSSARKSMIDFLEWIQIKTEARS